MNQMSQVNICRCWRDGKLYSSYRSSRGIRKFVPDTVESQAALLESLLPTCPNHENQLHRMCPFLVALECSNGCCAKDEPTSDRTAIKVSICSIPNSKTLTTVSLGQEKKQSFNNYARQVDYQGDVCHLRAFVTRFLLACLLYHCLHNHRCLFVRLNSVV